MYIYLVYLSHCLHCILSVEGSPIWKPRELPSLGESTTLPRKGKSASEFGDINSSHSASRKSLIEINNCAQQSNCNNHI